MESLRDNGFDVYCPVCGSRSRKYWNPILWIGMLIPTYELTICRDCEEKIENEPNSKVGINPLVKDLLKKEEK